MSDVVRPRRTRTVFIVLAWVSFLLPVVALPTFWMSIMPDSSAYENLPQGDRHAYAEAKRKSEDALHLKALATVATCMVGVVLAVVSLCGIRTREGVAIIVPGACLGILAALF